MSSRILHIFISEYSNGYDGILISGDESKSSKLAEFILKLQEDMKFLVEFTKNPDKVMIEAGISSEEERNILKSGDILKVRRLLAGKEMR